MKSKPSAKRVAAAEPAPAVTASAPVRKPRVRKPAAVGAAQDAAASIASLEMIARRAYDLFLAEGAVHGRDLEHWLAAERELGARES